MKIGRFLIDGKPSHGIIEEDSVLIGGVKRHTQDLQFLPPCEPSKIVCIGLNYADHAGELGMKVPDEPVVFLKPPTAINHHGGTIYLPPQSRRTEYEAELAMVVKQRCKNVRKEDAREFIYGLTCFNDVTARDLQEKDGQWTRAKGFDSFAPAGPWITTVDEFEDLEGLELEIRCSLNGRTVQKSDTSELIFSLPYLLEFISSVMTLEEGDLISTGTPPGIGKLTDGDTVEVSIERVGALQNHAKSSASP